MINWQNPFMKWDVKNNQENSVWMQFTGLKDKNGKEIYEGDIVKLLGGERDDLDGEICHVYYRGDLAAFGLRNQNDIWAGQIGSRGMYGGIGSGRQAEIIGNIYENPELLSNPKQKPNKFS